MQGCAAVARCCCCAADGCCGAPAGADPAYQALQVACLIATVDDDPACPLAAEVRAARASQPAGLLLPAARDQAMPPAPARQPRRWTCPPSCQPTRSLAFQHSWSLAAWTSTRGQCCQQRSSWAGCPRCGPWRCLARLAPAAPCMRRARRLPLFAEQDSAGPLCFAMSVHLGRRSSRRCGARTCPMSARPRRRGGAASRRRSCGKRSSWRATKVRARVHACKQNACCKHAAATPAPACDLLLQASSTCTCTSCTTTLRRGSCTAAWVLSWRLKRQRRLRERCGDRAGCCCTRRWASGWWTGQLVWSWRLAGTATAARQLRLRGCACV